LALYFCQVQVIEVTPQDKSEDVQEEVVTQSQDQEYIDFSNGWLLTAVASLVFIIVLAANMYVIVMLGLGRV
jgi:metal iron transporter